MPEVSEVALTTDILNKYLKGKKLIAIKIDSGRYAKKPPEGLSDFKKKLPLKLVKVDSIGKFIWFEFKTGKSSWYIWNTLGLTGMWSVALKPNSYRLAFKFSNRVIYYSDTRNFGTFKFTSDTAALNKKIKELTPDFLKTSNFSLVKVQKYKMPIVKILMDQKKVGSGLGNYLTAEILYRAKISPHRLGTKISNRELVTLKYWIKYVVKLAYIDNHTGYMVNLEEDADKIKRKKYHPKIKIRERTFKFMVYRRKTDPYGNRVKADKIIGGRSTYWVPSVQK
jgi:formamidopyrimidine-DNA glycosylase